MSNVQKSFFGLEHVDKAPSNSLRRETLPMQALPPSLLSGVNFINVLRVHFSYKCLFGSYMLSRKSCQKAVLYVKFVRLTLMKLTTVWQPQQTHENT